MKNSFTYEKDTFIAKYYPKNSDTIIVTFYPATPDVHDFKNKTGWGANFIATKDVSLLAIIPKKNNWYRGKDLHDFLESKLISNLLKQYDRHLFVGGSMGGYAALVFSSIVKNAEVLAFNPQSTLQVQLVPWEDRYPKPIGKEWEGRFNDTHSLYLNKVFLMYDHYFDKDRKHAQRVNAKSITYLHFNNVGHRIPIHLKNLNQLKPMLDMFIEGTLSQENFKPIKESRKNLQVYQENLIKYYLQQNAYDEAIKVNLQYNNVYDHLFQDKGIERKNKKFIFIAGLHRSGTSLLYQIIRNHPKVSGFHNTGAPEDEGQHLQSVFQAAKAFGGPGKFAFNSDAYMNENHPLVSEKNSKKLFEEWSEYLDESKEYFIEKSPPNLIRTRFLQEIFPKSKFIVILRHPLAVSFATKRWSNGSTSELIEHYLVAYELFVKDIKKLNFVHVIQYEKFILSPQEVINEAFNYLKLEPISIEKEVKNNINKKYFLQWEEEKRTLSTQEIEIIFKKFEERVNKFGYSLKDPNYLESIIF